MNGLTYCDEHHAYKLDGRPAPGIHKILDIVGEFAGMPDNQGAMARGSRVHKMIEFDLQGDLHLPDLTDEDKGYLSAYRSAVKQMGLEINPKFVEYLVANRDLWYMTRVDALATWKGYDALINWKTGGFWDFHTLQSAAEVLACKTPKKRVYVYLNDNGTFNYKEFHDPRDFELWNAACLIANHRFKTGRARLAPHPCDEPAEEVTFPLSDSEVFEPPPDETVDGAPLFS